MSSIEEAFSALLAAFRIQPARMRPKKSTASAPSTLGVHSATTVVAWFSIPCQSIGIS